MIERSAPRLRPRPAAVVWTAMAVAALVVGCGGDGALPPVDGGGDDAADTRAAEVTPGPTVTAAIVASTLSGNAPLEVDFSVDVIGGEACATVTIEWSLDDAWVANGSTTTQTFFRAGSSKVSVLVRCLGASGASSTATDSVIVRVRGCADLTFERLTLASPVEVAPGAAMKLRVAELFNEGDAIEGDFDVLVALSVDAAWQPEIDLVVDRWTVPGMPSGLFSDASFDYADREILLDAAVPPGAYYVLIVADPDDTVNECQEANNVEVSTNNLTVDPDVGLAPDVTVTEVSLPAGLTVQQGQILNYGFTLANLGLGDAVGFRVGVWLSEDPVLSPETDRVVVAPTDDNAKINSLAAGAVLPFFKSYKIPSDLPDGAYWFIVQADATGVLAERDESNNVAASATPLTMRYVEPICFDLAATAITVEPLSTYRDGTVLVRVTIANPGTVPTPEGATIEAFISQEPSFNPITSPSLGVFTLPVVPPGESRPFEAILPIDDELAVGTHFVGVLLDPGYALEECSEANNALQFPQPITIAGTASLDLAVTPIAFHPATVAPGDTVKLQYALTNGGTSGATAFRVSFVLSPDATITRDGLDDHDDLRVGQVVVSSVPALGSVARVDEFVVPAALDHAVEHYHLGVVADDDPLAALPDSEPDNNIAVASEVLTVVGAQGGCYEDALEDNDAPVEAAPLPLGETDGLGLCGDDDWYTIPLAAGASLRVDLVTTPILALYDVPSAARLELRDPSGSLVASSVTGAGRELLRRYAVTEAGDWALTVRGRTADTRAAYSLDVRVDAPPALANLVASDVAVSPASLYPGGVVQVGFRETNTGLAPAASHIVRVWASRDHDLDPAVDVPVTEVTAAALAGLATRAMAKTFIVPAVLSGGSWVLLVEVDADGDVSEAHEDDNVAWGEALDLDATLVCADDDLEPNDDLWAATPLTLVDGAAAVSGRVVCPERPDWYAVELGPGDALTAAVSYTYLSGRGLLSLELWDPSGASQLLSAASASGLAVTLPWVWLPGTWTLRVANKAVGNNVGPYTYALGVTVAPGDVASTCEADSYEDNNSFARARPVGCGILTATLCNVDRDDYVLAVKGGVEVRLTMEHADAEARVRVYEAPDGAVVKSHVGNGLLTYTPATDGLLYVAVDPRNGLLPLTSFDYALHVEGIAGVDLSVDAVTAGAGTVIQGEDVLVSFSVGNACSEDAAPFVAKLWLSEDPLLDAADVDLATIAIATGVAAGGEEVRAKKVTVPASTRPGAYFLLVEADSGQDLAESRELNNVRAAALEVEAACRPDAFEPNDDLVSVADAPALAPPGAEDLVLCPGDLDWFAVTAPAGSVLTVSALFDPVEGDLDLRLYDPTSSLSIPVASSATEDGEETVVYPVSLATTFLVRVAGFQGASAPYALAISLD